jgi:hypothetical protein
MPSDRRIEANRRNARKSTGPNTAKGKQISRKNAIKHGLRARELLTPDEEPSDFESFCGDALRDLAPQGFMETELAEQIVSYCWRLRRCRRIEAELLGGGGHVMDQIVHTPTQEFLDRLKNKDDIDDMSESEFLSRIIIARSEAFDQGLPADKIPYSDVPPADLMKFYREALYEERQSNPFTYEVALAFQKDMSQHEALSKLARYETALHRSLYRALDDLQQLQNQRRKDQPSRPEIIDVEAPISSS